MKKRTIDFLNLIGLKDITRNCYNVFKSFYFNYFTIKGIKQTYNYKATPIIIISFNQLYYLRQLIFFLQSKQYTNIIIIDNNSTYVPLLDYFDAISKDVKIYRLKKNYGHLVFWENKELFDRYSKGYYVVTDADIVPDADCPEDFVLHFKKLLDRNHTITKVGFSLKIEDLPETNPNKQKVISWESQFWKSKDQTDNFIANIDTTFALYKPGIVDYKTKFFYNAIRTKEPYIAKHGGWDIDCNNLTEEQDYYLKTATKSASWLVDEKGNSTNKLYW